MWPCSAYGEIFNAKITGSNEEIENMGNYRVAQMVILSAFIFLLCVSLTGCADTMTFTQASKAQPVGFWYGVWHGMIAPFGWIVSLFSDSTAIYAIYNNGGWYDFGFMLGIGGLSSSTSSATRRRR
jgi:hypothetical protein